MFERGGALHRLPRRRTGRYQSANEWRRALRQRAEEELRELLETIPVMTVTVLPDGSSVFVGERFTEYSSLSAEDTQGSGRQAAVRPDDLDRYVRTWRASFANGEPIEVEHACAARRWTVLRAGSWLAPCHYRTSRAIS